MTRLIFGAGTAEHTWQCWLARACIPLVPLSTLVQPGNAVHVVAPHPDDEVLGCGGIIHQLGLLGVRVCVWAVTDGERCHGEASLPARTALAETRTRESLAALSLLNAAACRIRLGFPDGGLARAERLLAGTLAGQFMPGDTAIAPWHLDGHPDHEATSRACRAAARQRQCQFLEVPIWGWHWLDPDVHAFPVQRAISVALTPETQSLKSLAIARFKSQLHADPASGAPPILPDFALSRLKRPFEVVFR